MRLFGRELETRRIDWLLDSARVGRSGVLILRGEPGVGKTALLRYASERAKGMTVLRARGLEVEALLAFSGLADLFRPVIAQVRGIPPPQSAAITSALGIGSPVEGDAFVISIASLSLLAAAAEEQPVLAIVDDSQWLDVASREAIFFAARRLEAERVAMIIAALTPAAPIDSTGLQELVLSDLDRPAARELLEAQVGFSIVPQVFEKLMEATGGNPLGLRELSVALSERQLRGWDELGEQLPAAADVERAFLQRVGQLPAETRAGLVVVAAGSGVTTTIQAACERLGFAPTCLEAAEEAGVIHVERDRTVFTHPLLRAAVYHAAATGVRDRAHRALADALSAGAEVGNGARLGPSFVESRAWQLAAATHEPDESVAAALEAAASHARRRTGHAAAAAGLARAAELTPAGRVRANRLAGAAQDWNLAGRPDTAAGLLDEAASLSGHAGLSPATQHLRGQIEMGRGHFAFAAEFLEAQAAAAANLDPETAVFMLLDAAISASTAGSVGRAVGLARTASTLAQPLGGNAAAAAQVILGGERAFHGEALTREERDGVVDAAVALASGPSTSPILAAFPVVLIAFEEYERARMLLDRLSDAARGLGAPSMLVPVLCIRSALEFRTGEWIAAYADAAESLRLARETRQFTFHSLAFLARVEAGRGLATDCRAHAAEAIEQAKSARIGATDTYATWALGLLAIGLGRISEAVGHLERAADLVEEHEMNHPVEVPWAQDLVEAYVRDGRIDEAETVVEKLQVQAETTQLSSALAAAARCRGLLADEQSFAAEFERAAAFHAEVPTPFERARTELCYGERLRRSKRRSDARPHLRAALRTFEALDATPWIARACVELEATGEVVHPVDDDGVRGLTPQELQLALIVGRGATNKEASAALFISPKTVEAHLHRIYVKLGIRSRTELARLLAREHVLD